ncbi:MAG: LysR family transcriptional regulator, partial [Erysipelotrichaceae bacterium]|nr:LysR family transcriptional regulator [Erysipelotrichaceae bacterium]
MTLNQIEYFVEVARLENYRQAAERLHVSQPSLSRSIANLEEELQVDLFEKRGRGVTLTKTGKMFLEHADRILEECKAAQTKMNEISTGGGVIAIGYVFPLAGSFIPRHVRQFLSIPGNDQITFQFTQNHTPYFVEKVEKGQLDVGFGGCMDHIDLEYFPVASQELVIITPLGHPLEDLPEVSFEQLEQYPVIGYDRHSWMGRHT